MPNEIVELDLHLLKLDPDNPRLPELVDRDEQSMIDYIAESTSIEELMHAIGENGFFPGEPLIGVLDSDGVNYHIIEGNRRLTALKLLQDPQNCSNPGSRMREIAEQAKHKPTSIPVVVQPDRAAVLPYLGFRHITGVKQWEPLAKARYIKQLFDLTSTEMQAKQRYGEVARAIGSRRDHIMRNLSALAVYNVIKDNDFYGIDGLNEESIKFSVLSTALADDKIGRFVGIAIEDLQGDVSSIDPILHPDRIDRNQIKELTVWLYKRDEKGGTKVGESRNLRQLAAVVSNPKALAALRSDAPLNIAYQLTSDVTSDFVGYLYKAEGAIKEAASMVATVPFSNDGLESARRILETIKLIGNTLRSKKNADDEF